MTEEKLHTSVDGYADNAHLFVLTVRSLGYFCVGEANTS